jgi:hypothetical protein
LTDRGGWRERQRWIAVTALLATSLAWLATVPLVLLLNVYGARFPEALAVLRALARAALALGHSGGPETLAVLVVSGALLALALRSGTPSERQARHA